MFRVQSDPVKQKLLGELGSGTKEVWYRSTPRFGVELVEQSIGARHIDECAIHRHVRGNRTCVVDELDSGHGLGAEVIDQNALIGGHDVSVSCIRREEKINRVESALINIDVKRRKRSARRGLGDSDFLRAKRGERRVLGRVGGDDVDAGVVDAEEKVEASGFEIWDEYAAERAV